ncbi:putative uncharacterized protein [Burkholderiales bacterium GJ-E10]|nr:putative uncharacterized protein [Burkholderiales bacterium GJ-E10]
MKKLLVVLLLAVLRTAAADGGNGAAPSAQDFADLQAQIEVAKLKRELNNLQGPASGPIGTMVPPISGVAPSSGAVAPAEIHHGIENAEVVSIMGYGDDVSARMKVGERITVVHRGEVVDGWRVVSIIPQGVLLERGRRTRVLRGPM